MHPVSVTSGSNGLVPVKMPARRWPLLRRRLARTLAGLAMGMGIGVAALVMTAPAHAEAAAPPGPVAAPGPAASPAWFRVGAIGLSSSWRPSYPGASGAAWSATPNVVLHWGRLTLSNGGTLASRAGEPTEAGLTADVFSMDRLTLRAAVALEQGRRSDGIAGLKGLHDIPAHPRGRLQAAWRLHPQWELIGVWRGDLSDRGTGSSAEAVVLHEWRPEFLDRKRWRISGGAAAQWRDARQANLIHGVSDEDAARSAYPAYRLDAGWTDARLFANWRRDFDGPWVAYGALTWEALVREAAHSPIVQKPRAFTLSVGLGRRF